MHYQQRDLCWTKHEVSRPRNSLSLSFVFSSLCPCDQQYPAPYCLLLKDYSISAKVYGMDTRDSVKLCLSLNYLLGWFCLLGGLKRRHLRLYKKADVPSESQFIWGEKIHFPKSPLTPFTPSISQEQLLWNAIYRHMPGSFVIELLGYWRFKPSHGNCKGNSGWKHASIRLLGFCFLPTLLSNT